MNILVCISKAPDTTTKISFTDGNTKLNKDKVQFIVNPYDEWYALVRAIELKEQLGGTVKIISVGDSEYDPIIRKAIAIGADEAVRINSEAIDAYYVAAQIALYAKDKNFDLILTGKETINYNGSQVGAMIAEMLNFPYVAAASKLVIDGKVAKLERDVATGVEVLETDMPAVVSCAKGMAEQRIPNMRGIMAARTKPLEVLEPTAVDYLTEITGYELPEDKGSVTYIDPDNMDELVRLLHSEAKVI